MKLAEADNASAAVLFVDVAAACYTSMRVIFLSTDLSPEGVKQVLLASGLPPASIPLLDSRLASLPILTAKGMGDHFEGLLSEALRQSWFRVQGADRVAIAFRDTRPGTPLADALFLFIIAEVHNRIQDSLLAVGLCFDFSSCIPSNFPQTRDDQKVPLPGMAYADDTVFYYASAVSPCSHSWRLSVEPC